MRNDALGIFWEDLPPEPKVRKEAIKRTPPEPVWLEPDYLPYLEEASAFNFEFYTDEELVALTEALMYDIECYANYFLICFRGIETGKIVYFESYWDSKIDLPKLAWLVGTKCIVGFNINKYDNIILSLALKEFNNQSLKDATNMIIVDRALPWDVLHKFKCRQVKCNSIDLIEVAPLFASLKIYGGRMHVKRMQDLPFPPGVLLTEPQRLIVRLYCVNDLDNTKQLMKEMGKELSLRIRMSSEYQIDLRSKSDAQIAEAVINSTIKKIQGSKPTPPFIMPGQKYYYNIPVYLNFQTDMLQRVLGIIDHTPFVVAEKGNIGMPEELKNLKLTIGHSTYKMGIGGLHSTEKKAAHKEDDEYILSEQDVTSYYPRIILNQELYPQHLGRDFLTVYRGIVEQRLKAKAAGDKATSESLKITINGSFGKLGNKHSILYAPDLLIQVTVTGQLTLLLLIERLELAGISVVSANTDGLVIKCKRNRRDLMDSIIAQWEKDTGFNMEGGDYSALYSRDVNNYIAVKKKGGVKTKGIFSKPGLRKNPQNRIVVNAITKLLTKGTPIKDTILQCTDVTKFLTVRTVKGGAVKDGEYLGSAIRWYRSTEEGGEIVYAKTGNKVATSDGGKPLMDLPDAMPCDIDYGWYEEETEKILSLIGYEGVASSD